MMCGKPIIVNEGTSMANIVARENCGLLIKYNDVRALKNAIVLLRDNPKNTVILGENARAAYFKYSWDIMEKRLLELYRTCIS